MLACMAFLVNYNPSVTIAQPAPMRCTRETFQPEPVPMIRNLTVPKIKGRISAPLQRFVFQFCVPIEDRDVLWRGRKLEQRTKSARTGEGDVMRENHAIHVFSRVRRFPFRARSDEEIHTRMEFMINNLRFLILRIG
jgi:hypothetical protein